MFETVDRSKVFVVRILRCLNELLGVSVCCENFKVFE